MYTSQNSTAALDFESATQRVVFSLVKIACWWTLIVFVLSFMATVAQGRTLVQDDSKEVIDLYFMYEEPDKDDEDAIPLTSEQRATNKKSRANRSRDKQSVIGNINSGGDLTSAAMKGYFDGYVFAEITQPKTLSEIGDWRDSFFRTYMASSMSARSRKAFIESLLIPSMQNIIQNKDYYPAARVNAVVLLGLADDSPMERTSRRAPQPNSRALASLVTIYKTDAFEDYLKVAALSGILRHVQVDTAASAGRISGTQRQSLIADVLASLDKITKADPGLESDLNYWMARRSIQLLGAARTSGSDAQVFKQLASILDNQSKAPVWVRLDAVKALRNLPLTGVDQQQANAVVESCVSFLSTALANEASSIEQDVQELIYNNILLKDKDLEVTGTNYASSGGMMDMMGGGGGGMMGGGMMGGMGMGGGGGLGGAGNPFGGGSKTDEPPKPIVELPNYELNQIRRRIKVLTFSVKDVLEESALSKTAEPKHADFIKKVDATLRVVMKDSGLGIKDMDERKKKGAPEEEPQTESFAMQLKLVCDNAVEKLDSELRTVRGEEAAEPAPGGEVDAEGNAQPFGGG